MNTRILSLGAVLKSISGVGVMAQSANCFQHKHENPSSVASTCVNT